MYNYADISKIQMPKNLPKIPFDINQHIYQLDCQLFSKCNLNCKFCFQNSKRNSIIDQNYILSIPKLAFPYIKKELQFHKMTELTIFSWGGEVFMDGLSDNIFDIYIQYMQNFKQIIHNSFPHINLKFQWTSNGVFSKYQRVLKFLQKTNSRIAFSYDPLYRYNTSNQMNLAIKNFQIFKDVMNCIGIMLIKPMITESILNHDPILNSNYNIDINYYIGNTQYKQFLPSDQQTFSFYKWALDNKKFNFNVISILLNNIISNKVPSKKYCNCKYHAQFIANKFTNKCSCNSNYPDQIFYGKYTNQMTEQNCTEIKNVLAIQQRNCLSCVYYNICPMFCNIGQIFKYYKMDICPLFKAIEYIQNNDLIKSKYIQYLNSKK